LRQRFHHWSSVWSDAAAASAACAPLLQPDVEQLFLRGCNRMSNNYFTGGPCCTHKSSHESTSIFVEGVGWQWLLNLQTQLAFCFGFFKTRKNRNDSVPTFNFQVLSVTTSWIQRTASNAPAECQASAAD